MATVTLQDVAALQYCRPGCREFCAKNDLNWADFIREGFPEEVFAGIDDEMAHALIEEARRREAEEKNEQR